MTPLKPINVAKIKRGTISHQEWAPKVVEQRQMKFSRELADEWELN